MKNAKLAIWVLAAGLLAGCANHPATTGAHGRSWVDQDRVTAVEREAKRAGVEVRWVNPPMGRGSQS